MIAKFLLNMHTLKPRLSRKQVNIGLGSTLFTISIFILALLGARQIGFLEPLELAAYDWMMRQQPDKGIDPRLLVVEITEDDIRQQRRWPLPDQVIADALENLLQHKPAVIGLDNYRDFPQEPGHQSLVEQLQQPNIVVIRKLGQDSTPSIPAPDYVAQEQIGFNDLVVDGDGIVRRNLLYANFDEHVYPSFALRLFSYYLEHQHHVLPMGSADNPSQLDMGRASMLPLETTSGAYQNVDARGYQILLRYRTGQKVARHVTLAEVLAGDIKPEWVQDKIVLIGTTAHSIKDGFVTPFSAVDDEFHMPGVYIHAQIISHIISAALDNSNVEPSYEANLFISQTLGYRPLFSFWHDSFEIVWIIFWAVLGGILAWWVQQPFKLATVFIASLTSLIGISYILFIQGYWIPVSTPMLAFLISGVSVISSRLVYDALYDTLTGLPNRAFLISKFHRLQNYYYKLFSYRFFKDEKKLVAAVILWDIDRFKILNIVLGHRLGDLLLIELTQRIITLLEDQQVRRSRYTFSRVGGNEFGLLLRLPPHDLEVRRLAEAIQKSTQQPFLVERQEIFITASIGIAFSYINEKRDLLRDAYAAMYRAKTSPNVRVEVFKSAMESSAVAQFELERDLRQAVIQHKENIIQNIEHDVVFPVYYQPLVDLKTGKIAGFEALLRWDHEGRGIVPPGIFIPIAEETGLILPLGEWVLNEACRQAHEWQQKYPAYKDLMMGVNLSAKQFAQPHLIDCIQSTLNRTGLPAPCLKLEITESVIMDDFKISAAMMTMLKNLGVKLGIDDFGTGYSSLAYLTQMPTDTLKVDKSFVISMGTREVDMVIVETIIALAHSLNMNVIAEGIEELEHVLKLRSLDCEYGQGYYFSKPLPKDQAEKLLAGHQDFKF
ncbi:EAL domain-containing protein [Candidatus Albibeggiatoa sp. nov. NOAA]|uniref:EAL domain-containing protein n=1 Tax=Candidatus Albibeggiatoa sp. nov. NOAA TaxID=3162724 RepID=UPI0032F62074|nr:EAL domain-containing protein [Thiotrichaceae bacterium]